MLIADSGKRNWFTNANAIKERGSHIVGNKVRGLPQRPTAIRLQKHRATILKSFSMENIRGIEVHKSTFVTI